MRRRPDEKGIKTQNVEFRILHLMMRRRPDEKGIKTAPGEAMAPPEADETQTR